MRDSNLTKVTFGGGTTETVMSPVVLVAMLIAIALVFALPRRKILIPILLFVFLTPLGQNFNLGGLHLFAQRIVILCGCIRLLFLSSGSKDAGLAGGVNSIDKVFLAWAACRVLTFFLLYHSGGALVNQLGFVWDFVGGYILVRHLIRDSEDLLRVARVMALVAVVMAICMAYEHVTLTNVFGRIFGGKVIADVRNGKVRARGVFEQEILASAFGGTLAPLFIWLWHGGKTKATAVAGLCAAAVITVTGSSSTGISAFAAGVVALCCWPIRKYMKAVRWGIVAAILGLSLAMRAPVWFVLARVDFVGGSTGWDRANLIDLFVRHFSDWCILGTSDFVKWGEFAWDQCNEFVAQGEQGGLATLVLFIILLTRTFRIIGTVRRQAENSGASQWLPWSLGAVLVAHVFAFFGISYFDQSRVWWFVTLAMVAVVAADTPGLRSTVAAKQVRPELDEFFLDQRLREQSPVWALVDADATVYPGRGKTPTGSNAITFREGLSKTYEAVDCHNLLE
jgi:hypothetical protein